MKREIVTLAHGGGGSAMAQLLGRLVLPTLRVREPGEDAALAAGMLLTTDSFVVKPLVFPGGDIGELAVYGTVNDLAMRGGWPVAMTVGLIVEEGLPIAELEAIIDSIAQAAERCGVEIAGGDTKVVEAGRCDGLYVNTTGLGRPLAPLDVLPGLGRARPGDVVLINGPVGEHGIAVLAARENLEFAADVVSDCRPLHELCAALVKELGPALHCLHDPTRGGLAAALNELAAASEVALVAEEAAIPRTAAVEAACELLGFDSLQVANEGKVVAVVDKGAADAAVEVMRGHEYGRRAAIIGEVVEGPAGRVVLRTRLGTTRVLDMPSGELLPRIC